MGRELYRDWPGLREEYIVSSISLKALAQREGISLSTLEKRSRREGWGAARKRRQLEQSSLRLEQVTDKLLAKISQTIDGEGRLEARDCKALTSALKELGEVREQLGQSLGRGGRETLEVHMAEELDELSG